MQTEQWLNWLDVSTPWAIPAIALIALWIARGFEDQGYRKAAERLFLGALLVVAWGTLRTILSNEGCWIVHTSSMAVMIVGAVFPSAEPLVVNES